jgi:hypothetical protein
MPNRDGTGPNGTGPIGAGRGNCQRRSGRGQGRGNGQIGQRRGRRGTMDQGAGRGR